MPRSSLPITHRRVLAISVPIVLSNATVPLLGMVDTGVVGQLGEAAPIGAVGIGAIVISAIYWLFGFLRMGTTGLVAQARGGGDTAEANALLMRGLILAVAAGMVFLLFQVPIIWLALKISPASQEVEYLARQYLGIRIWSAPAAIAAYAMNGWLIAFERTKQVLLLQLVTNGLNIGLDLFFVLGIGWGVEGVAIATLIAEWSGAALAVYLCRSAFAGGQWRDRSRIFNAPRIRRMAAVNIDIMVRSVLLQATFISFLFLGGGLGDVTLAANQILLQFLEISAYMMDGFAFSAETLVGQALGAMQRTHLRRAALVTSQWGGAVVVGMAASIFFAGQPLVNLMTTAPDVRIAAGNYLPWMVAVPICGWAGWMLDGIFIGATRTKALRNAMFVSIGIYAVSVSLLLPSFGNHGLWAALIIFNLARAVALGLRYPALEASADGQGRL